MPTATSVAIHPSQFPARVQLDLLESLRGRKLNHKFLYDSHKQTQKWLALHEAFSPARTDPRCGEIYDAAFHAAADRLRAKKLHLLSLGCGGGQKDARLLELLNEQGAGLNYTPCDVSAPMVLVAQAAAQAKVPGLECHPCVCDLATADNLAGFVDANVEPGTARLVTFFGLIPNFEPDAILPRLAGLLQTGDILLLSANLAPGADYAAGVRRILPLYDNALTRDWLLTFLYDLGVEQADGHLDFGIEAGRAKLLRVAANFHFVRDRRLVIDRDAVEFKAGDEMRLFYSYRQTPGLIRELLTPLKIEVLGEWTTESEEEGVFLCQRSP